MPSAYSFETDLTFAQAVEHFKAIEDWFRKPNLDGKWLVRDNDRLGDYLSYYEYDQTDRSIVKSVSIFFDTCPKQLTLEVSTDSKVARSGRTVDEVRREHDRYVLQILLPSLGARNVEPSDFER